MTSLLAFPAFYRRPDFGMPLENTDAMDWFVLANLGFLFLMLGFFAGCAWMIWRRTTRPEPHIQLIMELDDHERTHAEEDTKGSASPEERAPWQRSEDWWKSSH